MFSLSELSGAFGDIGNFLAYSIPLSKKGLLSFPSALLYSGLFHILTGWYFNIPLPIQPQSTLSSIAITTDNLTSSQFSISGFITGTIVGLLGYFRVTAKINKYIPSMCVYAIQTGLGLSLLQKGIKDCKTYGHIWDVLLFSILIAVRWRHYTSKRINDVVQQIPFALLLFLIGVVISLSEVGLQSLNISFPYNINSSSEGDDWRNAFIEGTLSQLPVTLLNSVISTVDLSQSYFGEQASKVTLESVSMSITCMNSLTFIGNIPSCHGAGGIVAQSYAGAKTGNSMIFLGFLKIVLALFCGQAITVILNAFPLSIIGIMLGYCGLELVKTSISKVSKKDWIPFIVSVGTILAINTYIGFIVGWVVKLWCTNTELIELEENQDMC